MTESMTPEGAKADLATGWRPIETVPKDHFPRLVWSERTGVIVAFVDVCGNWWPRPAYEALENLPTHWMPLPAPPRAALKQD